ncbi:hypothetical protein REPUB_Repub17cG0020900 [Reevesia pubescens]
MGKKILSQVQAVKISKTSDKKQLNSLIKVLRPKVYITDSSSFKTLVQHLTGNGATVSQSLPSSSPQMVEKVLTVIDVEDHDHESNPESSMESSFNASSLESFQVDCNHLALRSSHEEIYKGYEYEPLPLDGTNSSEYIFMNQYEEYSLVYGELQSLLLDVDEQLYPNSFINVNSQIQQDIEMKHVSKEEFVHILRRQSIGFSRESSKYRWVNLHKSGRQEARMGPLTE